MTGKALNGEIALVTGASRGIGHAIALALGAAGATVIGTATGSPGIAAIDAALKSAGIAGRGIALDVADGAACDAAIADIEAKEGAVTILVNNAGITRDTLLLRMKPEDWDAVISTNLGSVFRLSKGVLRGMMKARKGRIINIASVVGLVGNAGQANYCAAKAGIGGFTRSLAKEVASRGITVNVVAPGLHRHGHDQVARRSRSAKRSRARSRSGGLAGLRTSPRRSASWRVPAPPGSRVRR